MQSLKFMISTEDSISFERFSKLKTFLSWRINPRSSKEVSFITSLQSEIPARQPNKGRGDRRGNKTCNTIRMEWTRTLLVE